MKNKSDISCLINVIDMGQKIPIKNTPQSNEVWRGIGGHFDFLSQILHEFIDNSISNFMGNDDVRTRNIIIGFMESGNDIEVTIEDHGTGIKDLDTAFCLGNTSGGDSPLNEHGFGMKHALASANPENNSWAVYTRTKEDHTNNQFKKIKSAYQLEDYEAEIIKYDEEQWPGEFNGTGTFVKFVCKRTMFNTLRKGIVGALPSSIDGFMAYFKEDLGFVYSNILKGGFANISIKTAKNNYIVSAVEPSWLGFFEPKPGSENVDLGNGEVKIDYEFGSIKESDNYRYYKRNHASQGVEIRINGRLLSHNIFKDIWLLEPHPTYNHLLVKLNIISTDKSKLPTTRTSKNGIREGDGKLYELYRWIKQKYPTPATSDEPNEQDEVSLFEKLANIKRQQLRGATVETQQYVFTAIGERARLDLYVNFKNEVTIYEGKTDKTTYKDVYQLRMYWDGCLIDGITPNEGVLISSRHPNSVVALLKEVNKMVDANGNKYNLVLRTWKEESLNYPD